MAEEEILQQMLALEVLEALEALGMVVVEKHLRMAMIALVY